MTWSLPLGAMPHGGGVDFRVWAPDPERVEVAIYHDATPVKTAALVQDEHGYWSGHVAGLHAGVLYMYRLGGDTDRPDPASRHQPRDVHGPSMVVDPHFPWTDDGWQGVPLEELVIYELHVGTATPAGTFEALIEHLADLRDLGINAIEIMPVADFPGNRNWGYDGVDLYAPARSYGGVEGMKRLVDAAHAHGLAVILDVVYNHLGPDGNYLRDFAQAYFTGRHHTPWGDAVNYDGPGSDAVRDFVIQNALYWAHEYHVDGLRLDATHAIIDDSPKHLLRELAERVRESLPRERQFLVIAEDGRNEANLLRPTAAGGMGLDGVWADDFHHTVRVTLTDEQEGYYRDYQGGAEEIASTIHDGWLYQGQVSPHQGERRGTPANDLEPPAFVYCIQNHDQIGNRAFGTRLTDDVGLEAYRAASTLLLLSPQTPMLFMGQEWAASTPFLFFTDHNPELGRLVTEGRREEFKHFAAFSHTEIPDPQAAETFLRSKLRWDERGIEPHAGMLRLYTELLRLRRTHPACRDQHRNRFDVRPLGKAAVLLRRQSPAASLIVLVNLRSTIEVDVARELHTERPLKLILDSEDVRYGGMREPAESLSVSIPLLLSTPRALVFSTSDIGI